MSTIQEKLAHTATLAKWKLDQQIRLNTSQTKEKQLLSQIASLKSKLADETFGLFKADLLVEENLKEICSSITATFGELDDQKKVTESIKVEQPPTMTVLPEAQSQVMGTATSTGGLICPNCNIVIPVKFCPNCGREGISQ